jgi:hypothetical protein
LIPKEVTLQGMNVTSGTTISAWETVTIGSNVNFANNQIITIRAPEIVVNTTLPSNVVLVRDYPVAGSLYKAPITDATVIRNFCNSSKYNTVDRAASRVADRKMTKASDKTSIFDQTVLYPNPASGTVHLAFTLQKPTAVNILLMDLGGKVLQQTGEQPFDVGRHELSFEISGIPKGIYLMRMESLETRKTLKLVISD